MGDFRPIRNMFVKATAFLIVLPLAAVIYGGLAWVLLATTLRLAVATGMPAWAAVIVVGSTMTAAIHFWWPIRDGGWHPPWKRIARTKDGDHG